MKKRVAAERGYFENSWLKSYHSFSFSEYYDPKHMSFQALRVINHDFIAANSGFGTHPHRDMEIMTYVLRGRVEHQDSMGNKKTIKAGEVQIMSAGRGVTHSEYNPDADDELELLQIWITPEQKGLEPYYDQKIFTPADKLNKLVLIASSNAEDGSLLIHQDVKIYASLLENNNVVKFQINKNRALWLQLAEGEVLVQGQKLTKGDGISFDSEQSIEIKGLSKAADFIIFDLSKLAPLRVDGKAWE